MNDRSIKQLSEQANGHEQSGLSNECMHQYRMCSQPPIVATGAWPLLVPGTCRYEDLHCVINRVRSVKSTNSPLNEQLHNFDQTPPPPYHTPLTELCHSSSVEMPHLPHLAAVSISTLVMRCCCSAVALFLAQAAGLLNQSSSSCHPTITCSLLCCCLV